MGVIRGHIRLGVAGKQEDEEGEEQGEGKFPFFLSFSFLPLLAFGSLSTAVCQTTNMRSRFSLRRHSDDFDR